MAAPTSSPNSAANSWTSLASTLPQSVKIVADGYNSNLLAAPPASAANYDWQPITAGIAAGLQAAAAGRKCRV